MPTLDLNQIREFSVPVEKQNNKKRESISVHAENGREKGKEHTFP